MKGKITKLNAWKNGKGSFIQFDGKQPEYILLTPTTLTRGETAVYEIGDKEMFGKQVLKSIRPDSIEAFEARDEDRAKPTQIPYRTHDAPKTDAKDEYWLNRGKMDAIKDAMIVRESCLSSAVDDCKRTNGDVIETAKRFEKFAREGV